MFQEGGAGSAEPQVGVGLEFLRNSSGTKGAGDSKRERARMVRYGVSKAREEIRKGLGTQG